MIEQCIESIDVIAACGPVKRFLRMATYKCRVYICAP